MKKSILLALLIFLSGGGAWAQTKVTGTVISSEDNEPVVGAYVVVQGTTIGALTDLDGHFEISNVPASATSLIVSLIGMKTVEVPVSQNVNVVLEPDLEMLDEIVVTAMGITREKKALGYATQDVKSEKLMQAASSDLASAISGKVSGVSITPSSGMPGASTKIVIRGARSFTGDNTPLYVVDGMPIASASDYSTEGSVSGSDYANRALDIDPNDIESINILKGQAASALYGMRAGNGVIIITTKSGRGNAAGKPVITASSNLSVSTVSAYPEYQKEYAQGSSADAFTPVSSLVWGPKIADLPDDPDYGGNTDNIYTQRYGLHQGQYYVPQRAAAGLDPWATPKAYDNFREFFRKGVTWSNSVSVSQNLGRGTYSFSVGNTKQTGIVPNTGLERYNARLNASVKLNSYFTTGFSGNFVTSHISKQTGANDGLTATLYGAPTSYDLKGIPAHEEGNPYQQVNYRTISFDAAYWSIDNNKFTESSHRFYGDAYLDFSYPVSPTMKINAKYQLGDDAYTTNYADIWGYGHSDGRGEIELYGTTINELNSLFTASFDWRITPELHFNLLYGNEFVNRRRFNYDEFGQNYNFAGWNNMKNVSSYTASSNRYKRRTIGNFANLSLDWRDMLFFNATGRYDIVSSMPHGNRGFFYPSVSLGFIFTELEPLKNDVLTFGKVRASYAEVGMAGEYLASYYSTPTFGSGFYTFTPLQYPIGSVVAYTPSSTVYDTTLKPQNTKSYEFGAELAFWNGLLTLDYTFSRQNIKDQIFEVPLAGSTGSDELMTNAGSVHTNAHEFTLGVKPVNKRNVKWDLSLNFTKVDNYVDELAEGVESIFLGGFVEPQVRAGIGDKFPVLYGTSYLRNENGDIVVDDEGYPQVGEEKVIGSVSPDFQVGVNTSLDLFKFKLSATFDWKHGGDMYCGSYTMMDYYGTSKRSGEYRSKESFLFELPAVKEVKDVSGNVTGYAPNDIEISGEDAFWYFYALNDISESFVHKTSFVKLREVSLSYPVIDRPALNLTVSAFARNIILWSKLKGFDPEASQGNTNMGGAFERFSLPGTSSYGFGVTLKF